VRFEVQPKRRQTFSSLKVYGVFAATYEAFIDLANQTGQTEIGAPGQISARVGTFTQKLGHPFYWASHPALQD
jgi:hypothetical protein